MFRFLTIFLLAFLIRVQPVIAYEFTQVNRLLDIIAQEYAEQVNLKQLSLKSGEALTRVDDGFKLYHSDSKAFLYHKNQLISTFMLPEGENVRSWKKIICDILDAGMKCSERLVQKQNELETETIKIILENLDDYSRVDAVSTEKTLIDYKIKDDILYVKLHGFNKGQAQNLRSIILQYPNAVGLILDLRDNHGGSFNEALRTADLFLDENLITYSSTRHQTRRYYTSSRGDILKGKPIAVLANEYTASAAEIVAAALVEQSRATLVGTKTFGKGSIQRHHKFDKDNIFLTSGYFFSPAGHKINKNGVMPQICTGIQNNCFKSDRDNPQKTLQTAIQFIKKHLG